jgi:hypothetical protein
MIDPWLQAVRGQLDEITGRLEAPETDRDAIKRDIIALFTS